MYLWERKDGCKKTENTSLQKAQKNREYKLETNQPFKLKVESRFLNTGANVRPKISIRASEIVEVKHVCV